MAIEGLNASHLSAGLQHSIDVLWEGREMSSDMKAFFNHYDELSPEMQKHWETYYKNLEKAMVSVRKTEQVVDQSKSCVEIGPSAQGRLQTVENGGKATVLGGGGIVVFSGATVGPSETAAQMKKKAGGFGIIGLLNGESPVKCRK